MIRPSRRPATAAVALGSALAMAGVATAQDAPRPKAAAPAKAQQKPAAPAKAQRRPATPAPATARPGDDKEGRFADRAAFDAHYDEEFAALDKRRIADLAALAAKLDEAQAEIAYQDLFNLAVTRELFEAAEPAADAYLAREEANPQTRALATLIRITAKAEAEQYPESLGLLDEFLKAQPAPGPDNAEGAIGSTAVLAVGEAFLQRLMRSGMYDTARKAAVLLAGSNDPAVKAHFASRQARLEMLGRPAPTITAKDLDGEVVNLAELQGKVVLVNFWATWAPPSVADLPRLNALAEEYGDQGFAVIGVNFDGARPGLNPDDAEKIRSAVREFLVTNNIAWPNLINESPEIAKAYGVSEIPAQFLVDREGKIVHIELTGQSMKRAVEEALGVAQPGDAPAAPK